MNYTQSVENTQVSKEDYLNDFIQNLLNEFEAGKGKIKETKSRTINQQLDFHRLVRERFAARFVKPELFPSNGKAIRKVDVERFEKKLEKWLNFTNNIMNVFVIIANEWKTAKEVRSFAGYENVLRAIPLTKLNELMAGGRFNSAGIWEANRTFKDDVNCLVEMFFIRAFRGNSLSNQLSEWAPRDVPLVDSAYIELLNFVIDEQPDYLNQIRQFVFSKPDDKKSIAVIAEIRCSAITNRFVEVMNKSMNS